MKKVYSMPVLKKIESIAKMTLAKSGKIQDGSSSNYHAS
jgi:hypothetical protein